MSSAIDEVFSIPELVEPILEYACYGEPWQETKDLRLVCKTWSNLSIKPLYSSTQHPLVYIKVKRRRVTKPKYLTKFRAVYPLHCPLPFQVKISGHLNPLVFQFLQEFASYIVELELKVNSDYAHEEPPIDVNFQLVNLKKLSVYLELCRDYSYLNLEALRDKILEHAKGLSFFKIEYNYRRIPSMPLPEKLTHLQLFCSASELERLIAYNDLPCLTSLDVSLQGQEGVDWDCIDFEKTNNVLARLFTSLKTLSVSRRAFTAYSSGAMIVPLCNKLKSLSLDVEIATQDDVLFCIALPDLENATFTLSERGLQDLGQFMAPGSVYQNLKSLTIQFRALGAYGVVGEDDILSQFRESTVPECPSLEHLNFSDFSDEVLSTALPKMFAKWTSIKHLRVGLKDNDMDGSKCPRYTSNDIVTVITGVRKKQVPKDEQLWSNLLQGRTNSITHLTALEKLELEVTRNTCWNRLGKFVFEAAFFQMEKLNSIELFGTLEVDNEMVEAWRASGREIALPPRWKIVEQILPYCPAEIQRARGYVPY